MGHTAGGGGQASDQANKYGDRADAGDSTDISNARALTVLGRPVGFRVTPRHRRQPWTMSWLNRRIPVSQWARSAAESFGVGVVGGVENELSLVVDGVVAAVVDVGGGV